MGRRESIMKLIALTLATAYASQMEQYEGGTRWPACNEQSPCGIRAEFEVLTNAACTISFDVPPAWINAGGIFTTVPGNTAAIYVHTYDSHGEGIYMMPFNYASNNNNATYALGIKNTAGHTAKNMYNVSLKNRLGNPVDITDISVQAQGGVIIPDGANGKFSVILEEDYNGEMLMVNFRNSDPASMGPFDGAQSFFSSIDGDVIADPAPTTGY